MKRIFTLLAFLCSCSLSAQQNLSNSSFSGDYEPSISSPLIVWRGERDGISNIFTYNGSSIFTLPSPVSGNLYPKAFENNIAWIGTDGFSMGAFFYDGANITQLTDNNYAVFPPEIWGSNVAWYAREAQFGDTEIFYFDGSLVRQLTDNIQNDQNVKVWENKLVWEGWDGSDWELFYFNGTITSQLTNNTVDDVNAEIAENLIVWQHYDGSDFEIMQYDGLSFTQITDNTWTDENPLVDNGKIAWMGAEDNFNREIFYYDGASIKQISSNKWHDELNAFNKGKVVWTGGGMNSWGDLFCYDGSKIYAITYNDELENGAGTNGTSIVWSQAVVDTSNGEYNSEIFEINLSSPNSNIRLRTPSSTSYLKGSNYSLYFDAYGLFEYPATFSVQLSDVNATTFPLTPTVIHTDTTNFLNFTIPNNIPSGNYKLRIVSAGNVISNEIAVTISGGQLIQVSFTEEIPRFDLLNNKLTWESSADGFREIYYYNGSTTTRLTNNSLHDVAPKFAGSNIFWYYLSAVYSYDGVTVRQLTPHNQAMTYMTTSGNNAIWQTGNLQHNIYISNGTSAIPVTNNSNAKGAAQISGRNVVWDEVSGGNKEIFFYDSTTTIRISSNATDDFNPRLSGNRIIWQNGNGASSTLVYFNGSVSTTLFTLGADNCNYQISRDKIVFEAFDGNDKEIYYYNGTSVVQITNNSSNDFSPQFVGDNFVWEGYAGSDTDIFYYNGTTIRTLSENTINDGTVLVAGNHVVWKSGSSFTTELNYFHALAGTVKQITDNSYEEYEVDLSGNFVAWNTNESTHLGLYRLELEEGAPLAGIQIPDPNLRAYLKETYPAVLNAKNELVLSVAETIVHINCNNYKIKDISGIQYFTSLRELFVDSNEIEHFPDLSTLTKLEALTFGHNKITEVPDLSGNLALSVIIGDSNNITTFPDLTNNTKLIHIDFQHNNLSIIPDLSFLTNLEGLIVSFNPITSFPSLNQNLKMKRLWIRQTLLDKVPDLAANTELKHLDIQNNQFSVFPVLSHHPKLEMIQASFNNFSNLTDFSNTKIGQAGSRLQLWNNKLTFEDLLPLMGRDFMELSYTGQNFVTDNHEILSPLNGRVEINLNIDKDVTSNVYSWIKNDMPFVTSNSNKLIIEGVQMADTGRYYAVITNPNVPGLNIQSGIISLQIIDKILSIPDPNFKQCLKETYPFIFDENDNIILEEAKKIETINCANRNIENISGIEVFVNAITLNFDTNRITEIPDLSKQSKLTTLYFGQNRLTSLPDLSGNVDLEFLSFYANSLTTLPDISRNDKITYLEFQKNSIRTIPNLSHLQDLSVLSVAFNPLETIASIEENPELSVLNIQATSLTVFPDVSKNLNLKQLSFGKNPQFSTWPQIALNINLEYLHCDGNGLTTLPDLSVYPKLLALVCSQNKLQTLPDLSIFPSLNYLDCRDNFLTSLPNLSRTQIGQYPSHLYISGNHLTFEDLIPVVPFKTYVELEYANQTLPLLDTGITKRTGTSFTLTIDVDKNVTDNIYSWYRNNNLIGTTHSNTFYIDSLSVEDEGLYYCEVTNHNVADLIIKWREFKLQVELDTVSVCQRIDLKRGWNLISTYITPKDAAMGKIFEGMSDVIVKNASGTILYASSFGIIGGGWNPSEGYMVYTSNDQQLKICGKRINARTPLSLEKYSYPLFLPYYGDVEMSVSTALEGLGSNYNFVQSIEYLNGTTLPTAYNYIPSHIIDPAIDQIGRMKPGLAYKVSLQDNISDFRFPENIRNGRMSGDGFELISATNHFAVSHAGNEGNAIVVIPNHILQDRIFNGDEIAVIDNTGDVLGASVYEGISMAITIWGNTELKHNAFGVKVWDKETDQEFTAQLTYSVGSGFFVPNSLSIADRVIFPEEAQDFAGVYPNPANRLASFSFDVPREQNVRIILLNVFGNEIAELTNRKFSHGKHTATFDVSKLHSGQYVYRIIMTDKVVNNKLIIIKN
jgi:Leucine-rich repeat (LRR) protein